MTPPPEPVVEAAPPAPPRITVLGVRGTYEKGEVDFNFVPCDGAALTWSSLTPLATELQETFPNAATAYVELRARKDGETLSVRSLDVVEVEGHGCAFGAKGWQLRAFGNEPFWHAELHGSELHHQRMDDAEPTVAAVDLPAFTPKTRIWSTQDGSASLAVERKRCTSTMAAAFYPYTATLTVGDWSGTGCARTPPP